MLTAGLQALLDLFDACSTERPGSMGSLRRIPVTKIPEVLELRGVPADEWLDLQELIERVDRAFVAEANRSDESEPAPLAPEASEAS